MRLSRVYRFSASHRLHTPHLSDEDNVELYGKCANPHGHGHDYVVHVSVKGPVDVQTGRVIPLAALDEYVKDCVLSSFDHQDMNSALPEFRDLVPTTENVVRVMEQRLRTGWTETFGSLKLDRILIEETERNTFELRSI